MHTILRISAKWSNLENPVRLSRTLSVSAFAWRDRLYVKSLRHMSQAILVRCFWHKEKAPKLLGLSACRFTLDTQCIHSLRR